MNLSTEISPDCSGNLAVSVPELPQRWDVRLAGWISDLFSPPLLAIPLVGWARVRLNRYTPAQVLAGMLVGIGITLVLLHLI
jgi:membrane-associated phospholipid phosphatase